MLELTEFDGGGDDLSSPSSLWGWGAGGGGGSHNLSAENVDIFRT